MQSIYQSNISFVDNIDESVNNVTMLSIISNDRLDRTGPMEVRLM